MSKSMISRNALQPFGLKIDHLNTAGVAGARAIIRDGAEAIGDSAIAKVPKKTGATAGNIDVKQEDSFGNTWSISSRTLQGYLMQWGVKGHDVAPKSKKAMKIGAVIIRGKVKHPGVKARRWLTNAYKEIAPIVTAQLEGLLGGLIRKK